MKYLSLEELKNICREVANSRMVRAFSPEAVIFIENAGRLIGIEIARNLKIPYFALRTERAGHSLKDLAKNVFNKLPWQISHIIRKIELSTSVHKTLNERKISVNKQLPANKYARLLLVDDAIDTGISMKSVYNYLKHRGYTNIMTVVLTTTSNKPLFKADLSYFNELITFPWSIGAREYYQYQEIYRDLEIEMQRKCIEE